MNHPAGFTVTVLRPSTRGKKNRKICMTRQQVRGKRNTYKYYLSDKPRSL